VPACSGTLLKKALTAHQITYKNFSLAERLKTTEDLNSTKEYIVMKKYKIAAILMIIHGGFMELGGIFAMISALLIGTDKYDIGQYFEFKLPYFQDNLYMMMVMGAIYGVFRLIGAIGLLKIECGD
jgi:hypothetical protein